MTTAPDAIAPVTVRASDDAVAPFAVRGVVEGFYGPPYTFPQRDDLIRFIAARGYNLYIYAPKNDRQHRSRWREPYPAKIMARFGETVRRAAEVGVDFSYAISPGVSMCYSSPEDFAAITGKLSAFYELGVRQFGLFLDDIGATFRFEADCLAYATYGAAHVSLANRLAGWLADLDPACRLSVCPVEYHGRPPFGDYLAELGAGLWPEIDLFYTGPEICSCTITAEDVAAFAQVTRRKPVIWDNYPVNDLAMQGELHIGPVTGRDPALAVAARGLVVNTMLQPEASKIALWSYAAYFADPCGYEAIRTWEDALAALAGEDECADLRLLADNVAHSCLCAPEAELLARLVGDAMEALRAGEKPLDSRAVQALDHYLTGLDEACYRLTNWLDNLALRNELLPWIELLDLWYWTARRALMVLYACQQGEPYEQPLGWVKEWQESIRRHPKRASAEVLGPFVDYVLALVEG
jgi:hyaluronoglucosaminidase